MSQFLFNVYLLTLARFNAGQNGGWFNTTLLSAWVFNKVEERLDGYFQ